MKLVIETDRPDQAETLPSPKPAPSRTKIKEIAAAVNAPAMIAGHDTADAGTIGWITSVVARDAGVWTVMACLNATIER
ncbi:MAG: hypothetical protein ACREFC_00790 [Stellaceae bacterium]